MDTIKNIQANRSLRRRIIFALLLLILLIAFVYLLPDKKSGQLSVSSLEGEQADLVYDLVWYKSLIGPIRLEGKITLDEQEYESVEMGKDKWTYRISKKIKGDKDTPLFVKKKDNGILYDDFIDILFTDINLESLAIYVVRSQNEQSKVFYGPAETAKEAEHIY